MSEYVSVGRLSDFPEGKIRRRFVAGKEIGVVCWRERFYAFDNFCPHNQFQLNFGYIEDDRLNCPLHFAVFDLASGRALEGPLAIADLPVYGVRVEGDDVLVNPAPPD